MSLPTPYWTSEDGRLVIYHGDCREILPTLTGVDAVVSDPPYGIGYKGGTGGNLIHSKRHRRNETVIGDDAPFEPQLFLSFPHVALFGAQHFYSRLPEGGTFHVWDKRGDYKPFSTSDFDTIWVNRKEVGRSFHCVWRGLCRDTEHDQRIEHPTQKPLVVMRWVLEMFPEADLILDPFMGSGTTLRAAADLGRKAIGIELDERFVKVAIERLRQGVLL